MTFKQVKKKAKNDSIVYISSKTCWWTDDPEDLKSAKELFVNRTAGQIKKMMKIEVDFSKRAKMQDDIRRVESVQIPVDPVGAPLFQGNLKSFLAGAMKNKHVYGKYGLRALMSAHHKNCNGLCYTSFEEYPVAIKATVGAKGWHRYFGWCEITHVPNKDGKTLVDSEFDRVEVYQIGKGWKTYEGEPGEKIVDIYLPVKELFEEPAKDMIQSLLSKTLKQFKREDGELVEVK